jgi:phosphoketolase
MPEVLSKLELEAMHAYWRAANYLSVGQSISLTIPCCRNP